MEESLEPRRRRRKTWEEGRAWVERHSCVKARKEAREGEAEEPGCATKGRRHTTLVLIFVRRLSRDP